MELMLYWSRIKSVKHKEIFPLTTINECDAAKFCGIFILLIIEKLVKLKTKFGTFCCVCWILLKHVTRVCKRIELKKYKQENIKRAKIHKIQFHRFYTIFYYRGSWLNDKRDLENVFIGKIHEANINKKKSKFIEFW